jgi:hypothetical protein
MLSNNFSKNFSRNLFKEFLMHTLRIFQSEWLKTRRSLASWLVIIGGLFTPVIIFLIRIRRPHELPPIYQSPNFWQTVWNQSWESMAMFMFPMGIIMATGLITQLEFKNNAWKQLHTTPQRLTTIYGMKLFIVLVMLTQVFIAFNVFMYLFSVLPVALVRDVRYPTAHLDWLLFLRGNFSYFIDCLPIVGLQFLLGMHFKNFLVPFGLGFLLWIASLTGMTWEYNYILPYSYSMQDFLVNTGRKIPVNADIHVFAAIYFVVFVAVGYGMYIGKNEKG